MQLTNLLVMHLTNSQVGECSYCNNVAVFNTSANMSKVDIKARVEGIKLFFNEAGVRKTDKQYFVKSEYPVCEMFISDVPQIKETVFYNTDEIPLKGYGDESSNIAKLIDSGAIMTVTATIQHGMYGTMRMSDIETTNFE